MQQLWRQYSAYFHIAVWIFAAGIAWANVSAQSARIDKIEAAQSTLSSDISAIKVSSARIEQKVDSLAEWMRGRSSRRDDR